MGRVPKPKFDPVEFASSVSDLGDAIRSMDDVAAARWGKEHTVKVLDMVPLEQIKDRAHGDLRPVDLEFVLKQLMPSIVAVGGLIHALVLNQHYNLICGGHRLASLRLLAMEPEARGPWIHELAEAGKLICSPKKLESSIELAAQFPQQKELVPVRIFRIDSDDDLQTVIEIAENEKRRDFTREEVWRMKEALEARGAQFGGKGGRPSREQSVLPKEARQGVALLSTAFGKSERHIRRLLAVPKGSEAVKSPLAPFPKLLKRLLMQDIDQEVRDWAEQGLAVLEKQGFK